MPRVRISLAQKCQLLFGAAVLLIVCAALVVLWGRMASLVTEAQLERARGLADAYLKDRQLSMPGLTWVEAADIQAAARRDPFIGWALGRLNEPDAGRDVIRWEAPEPGKGGYRYARLVQNKDKQTQGLLLIDEPPAWSRRQSLLNRAYTIVAGLLAVLLAIVVFWLITTRLILSPVRVLRNTAEKVAEGDLNIRSVIHTGDEFEQLSDTFNTMLTNLKASQDKLRELNRQLDLKIGELAESNVSLYEANRIKGEFLANVSHELRTPLNSIIGFAEVLAESTPPPVGPDGPQDDKRRRYIEHILTSGRSLLVLINELLDLAKIEAGRMDLHPEQISIPEVCQILINLIRPQADRKRIELVLEAPRRMPTIQTDPGKFQQIVFNFLSNAVKFTPEGGRVELGASALSPSPEASPTGVKVWVSDTGPGIAPENQGAIFEKFHQLDPTHTREHGGTGLGLAISRELARALQGRIELDSTLGRGSTFSLIIPLVLRPERAEVLMPQGAPA